MFPQLPEFYDEVLIPIISIKRRPKIISPHANMSNCCILPRYGFSNIEHKLIVWLNSLNVTLVSGSLEPENLFFGLIVAYFGLIGEYLI